MPAALTIAVGATAAEARQQLVLRTFASTAGDAARTGKVLGISEREVRVELMALVSGSAPVQEAAVVKAVPPPPAAVARPSKKKEPAPPPRPPAKKPTARKGR